MSENLKTDSKRLQTIAWTCTFLACLFLEGMYFGAGFVIDTFANMFSGMGVEPPPVARFVFNNRYLKVHLLGNFLAIRDITGYV
ncbi:MAG TPA: hypothetical protein VG649_06215 [Candidatus Angelobacter sp.]|jgi:hypothetical protein|nr:hypothetical protein [Candidatus Angelobacter sp.]